MDETGGSKCGEPFDLFEVMDIPERLAKVRLARQVMGDDWYRKEIGRDPALDEAALVEKMRVAREKLRELNRRCAWEE